MEDWKCVYYYHNGKEGEDFCQKGVPLCRCGKTCREKLTIEQFRKEKKIDKAWHYKKEESD